jgi:excisionase family DNA binding protein
MPDEFLTVQEIADRFKLNQQTVRNWIDDGALSAVRLGARRVRVREADLEAFLAASQARHEQLDAGDPWAPVYTAALRPCQPRADKTARRSSVRS